MVIDFSPFYDMNRLVEQLLDESRPRLMYSQRGSGYPPLNVSENEDALFVRCEVPGMAIEDLDISLADSTLVIKGERKHKEGKYYRQERPTGAFQRVVSISGPLDVDKIKASMKDGILEIRLPKAEAFKPRKIDIQ